MQLSIVRNKMFWSGNFVYTFDYVFGKYFQVPSLV